ncbi:MAG: PKD domain-containing protein, partial [Bacteroidota bacterium]
MRKYLGVLSFIISWLLFYLPGAHAQLVTTVAGQVETTGDADGLALQEALFNNPHGIAVDGQGYVYIADRWNHKIKKYDPYTGTVSTLAGTGDIGADNGPGATARFYSPWGLACDSAGNVYVADTKNQLIRKIDTNGMVSTIAGTGSFGVADGPAAAARFADPTGIAIAADGTIYVCDHVAHTIRRITTNGNVSTIAGKAFIDGYADGPGLQARFFRPYGIEMDWDGSILIADEWNHRIRRVQPTGFTSTIAGSGLLGSDDGPASQARFNYPWDLVSDQDGAIYVMDGYNYVIRKIEGDSVITYAGEAGNVGGIDGYGIEASFSGATAISMDHRDNTLYVGDAFNELIRKVEPSPGINLLAKTYYPNGDSITYYHGDTLCLGDALTYVAVPTSYTNYDFYINEVFTQTGISNVLAYQPTNAGTLEVEVEALSPEGITFRTETFILHIVDVPKADFDYSLLGEGPEGFSVQFTSESSNAFRYLWDFGDPASGSENSSTSRDPIHVYPSVGSYDASLIAIGEGGCADTLYRAGFVSLLGMNVQQPLGFSPGDTLCVGDNLLLEASEGNFSSYEFYVNNQLAQNGANRSFSLDLVDPGTYDIYVRASSGSGEEVNSRTISVISADAPNSDFSYSVDGYDLATGFEVNFSSNAPDAQSYLWDFGDPTSGAANNSSLANPQHFYISEGNYDIQLISIGAGLCADTLSRAEYVKLMLLNSLDIHAGDSICVGSTANFVASNNSFPVYEFYLNENLVQRSPQSNLSLSPQTAGLQSLRVRGIDNDGEVSNSPPFIFYAANKPNVAFSYTDMGLSPQGLQIDFLSNTSGALRYLWDFGDPASGTDNTSSEANPTHFYAEFGSYNPRLIAYSGNMCSDSAASPEPILYEDRPNLIFVPTAFSPNGDGLNDILYLRGQRADLARHRLSDGQALRGSGP